MKLIKKYQMGGEIPAEQQVEQTQSGPETATTQSADPMEQILEVVMQLGDAANQALQSQDPNQMAQVLQALTQFASDIQAQIGGGPQEQPVFKKGGVIVRKKKMKCGGKTKK